MTDGAPEELAADEIDSLLREAQEQTAAARAEADGLAPTHVAAPQTSLLGDAVTRAGGPEPKTEKSPSTQDINLLLEQAEQAIASIDAPNTLPDEAAPFQLRNLSGAPANQEHATLELIQDVDLDVRVELGRSTMQLEEVLQLKQGSVVPLDRLAGDPVDIFVNGRLIARGEILVLNDNFCIRVGQLVAGSKAG